VNDAAQAIETAREYYNSDDADNFYATIWGGEDIHIGLYRDDVEPIAEASRRTVARMAELAAPIDADTRVLDIGSGYAGSARWLTAKFGCHCTALNLSERENERARELNAGAGLAERIDVIDGAFEDLPFPDASFDLLWSQDAFLHSGHVCSPRPCACSPLGDASYSRTPCARTTAARACSIRSWNACTSPTSAAPTSIARRWRTWVWNS